MHPVDYCANAGLIIDSLSIPVLHHSTVADATDHFIRTQIRALKGPAKFI
jgi:hypothetical protein